MSQKLLDELKQGKPFGLKSQILLVFCLAMPAILSQISTIAMQYIDSAMVGRLGSVAAASIGLISSTTWLLGGLCTMSVVGYSVQATMACGAREQKRSFSLICQGLMLSAGLSLCISAAAAVLSFHVPYWLQATGELAKTAGQYLFIFCLFLPFQQLNSVCTAMLQSQGDMKGPSLANAVMCLLDVLFNFFFIFDECILGPFVFHGLGLNVFGAAIGTGLSQVVISLYLLFRLNKKMQGAFFKRVHFEKDSFMQACRIGIPAGIQQAVSCSAYIAFTRIVAPLGTIAIAANSFGITAESLCYMPGYGISSAAAIIIGQSIGAGRKELTKQLGHLCVLLGVLLMSISGLLMFSYSEAMISFFTNDAQIIELGSRILKIEAFAEPMYGASIVVGGVLQGAGDTLATTVMNFVSMWLVRIPLAALFAGKYGLQGVWFAMAFELNVRGIIFLFRLQFGRWQNAVKKTL
jgi:putative MATE family efflux protein